MHVYVSIDIEGVAGVVHVDQTRRTGHDYERARHWMTLEANAAIAGAYEAGCTSILVNDSHGDMRNLVLDELDPRAEVIFGSLKPLSMVQGASDRFGVALFIGYHAGAGSRAGILDHTYYGKVVARLRVGGLDANETALNAMVLGAHGVPVGLVTGDETTCAQAKEVLGDVETVAVKEAYTRYAARTIGLESARSRIRSGALRAVGRAAKQGFRPYVPAPPHALEIDFVNSACADAAELVPGTRRLGGTTTAYEAPDADTVIRVIQAWTLLAASTVV